MTDGCVDDRSRSLHAREWLKYRHLAIPKNHSLRTVTSSLAGPGIAP
jgi:hypothetical protein